MFLSNGLMGKVIAYNGTEVVGEDGTELAPAYHQAADGGACIPKADGGYYYVSNSEQGEYPEGFDIEKDDADPTYRADFSDSLTGGAYSLEFNKDHELIGHQQILANTAGNCAGGATPWGTWVSCEERREFGRCWQTDPAGVVEAKPTEVTGPRGVKDYGYWEAIAYDEETGMVYTTDDDYVKEAGQPAFRGALVRYTPDKAAKACLEADADADKWCTLESGSVAYLRLDECEDGKFSWVADIEDSNPAMCEGSEGVHVENGILTFVTIVEKMIFELDLAEKTYTKRPVPFTQEPDNIRGFGGTMYICTDGDHEPGDAVWAVDAKGSYRLFHEEGHNYPAGVAFSPDGMRMFASMWGEATWMFWREDGLAFDDENAGITYEVLLGEEPGTAVAAEESDGAVDISKAP